MNRQRNQFKRGQNFSSEEEFLLITLAAEHRKVFENKKCDAVTWREKELAWNNLATIYSSTSGVKRSGNSLRAKYESLKKKLKAGLPYGEPPTRPTITEKLQEALGDEESGGENSDNDCIINEFQTEDLSEPFGDIIEFNEDNSNDNVTSKSSDPINLEAELIPPPTSPPRKSQRQETDLGILIQTEKLRLIRVQRKFQEQENVRAQERHRVEMETLSAKRELLYLEIAEKKLKLNDSPKE
ncbi:myb/SANT-like DNA-binding domain-containing protein 4 [Drosophila eugracilis]|uniref:myb/SANT-like DNA-binding domain-containing protein 4 n=1 Tax=Drosophila eugracilis TaxID=29029 RepID=UPI0007E842EA|nr:myb/SANT-like DNA-binding domain-containing protein 4 [Drosophila eugracilis]